MEKKLRLSHSLADLYYRSFMREGAKPYPSDREKLVNHLHGYPSNTSLAMAIGTFCHEIWENETKDTGKMPEFWDYDIGEVRAEVRGERNLNKFTIFSGIADVVSPVIIVDNKVGIGEFNKYLESRQGFCYKLLFPEARKFVVQQFNPFFESNPRDVLAKYVKEDSALDVYIKKWQSIGEKKGYKENFFLYCNMIEVSYGGIYANIHLEDDIKALCGELIKTDKGIQRGEIDLTIGETFKTHTWLTDVSYAIIEYCRKEDIPYWRLVDKETGRKL